MTSIFEIRGIDSAITFLAWTFAVFALVRAIFASFPAAEIRVRLWLREKPRRERVHRLEWELHHRAELAGPIELAQPGRQLDPAEISARRDEHAALVRRSLLFRAGNDLAGCVACQSFWVALLLFLLTRGPDLVAAILTAAACSTTVVLLGAITSSPTSTGAPEKRAGCSSCGKRK